MKTSSIVGECSQINIPKRLADRLPPFDVVCCLRETRGRSWGSALDPDIQVVC